MRVGGQLQLLRTCVLAKYRLDNKNKTVNLTARQYLAMNGNETTNILAPHCAYCQRYKLLWAVSKST